MEFSNKSATMALTGNQNQTIKEGQTMQWANGKGQTICCKTSDRKQIKKMSNNNHTKIMCELMLFWIVHICHPSWCPKHYENHSSYLLEMCLIYHRITKNTYSSYFTSTRRGGVIVHTDVPSQEIGWSLILLS